MSNKYAYGFCDRSGWRYPIKDLVEEYQQGRPTGLRVGKDMVDPDHPQDWVGRHGDYNDPKALENPRPDISLGESRRLFSWDPVGSVGLDLQMSLATVKVT